MTKRACQPHLDVVFCLLSFCIFENVCLKQLTKPTFLKRNTYTNYPLCVFLFFLVTYAIKSQNIPQIEALTTEQGLSFRDVRAIAQDTSGIMWFGTQQGINR